MEDTRRLRAKSLSWDKSCLWGVFPSMPSARFLLVTLSLAATLLSGCVPTMAPMQPVPESELSPEAKKRAEVAVTRLVDVGERMEPQIEAECRKRTRNLNCDYLFVVDDRLDLDANAFQTMDRSGRPVIGVTLAMIAEVRNADELAFVIGHEAAHHIAGHIAARERDAAVGAAYLGRAVQAQGADPLTIQRARRIGAEIGSRLYSKDYELEADRLGTIITWDAGYDPLKGAQFFLRLPDPGDKMLGSHPPNQLRFDVVRNTVAQLRAGKIPAGS
ncbi:M48 family metallopeptidase [Thioclava nitratireducens]|nr:M48 family metallopeptidase [Thioclava nitratireducens]